MNEKLISVIVPVYNVQPFLTRCVNSILNQTYKKIEIILVDDGSNDRSGVMCDELAKKDSRIIVIHKQNGGLSSARNTGLDVFRGEYVSFVDSDDYIEANMLEELLNSNELNNTLLSCCGRFDVFDNNLNKRIGLCPRKNEVISSEDGIKRILTWDNLDSASCDKLFHRSLWTDIRFPFGKISEDVAVMYKIFDKAGLISLISIPLYYYFHRVGSITTSSFSEKKFDVIDNVKSIEWFINAKYPSLVGDLLYFKNVQYEYILSLIAKSEYHNEEKEKELCNELKSVKRAKHAKLKSSFKSFILSHYTFYKIYRFLIKIVK